MVRVLGLDLGGLTLKGAVLDVDGGGYSIRSQFSRFFYPHDLEAHLREYSGRVDAVGVASSGEYVYPDYPRLSDGIWSFKRGLDGVFGCPIFWMNHSGGLTPHEEVIAEPYEVAAANWVATSSLLGERVGECILVDVGTSSADVIPIAGGRPRADGRYDYQRLISGELYYTGGVFTQVSGVVSELSVGGVRTRLSSEYFSTTGDVHLILGNIDEAFHRRYLGGLAGFAEPWDCFNRLAHMVCADESLIGRDVLADMAKQVWERQVDDVAAAISRVYARTKGMFKGMPRVVVAGSSGGFLAEPAAKKAGFGGIRRIDEFLGADASACAPAVGVGVLAGRRLLEKA